MIANANVARYVATGVRMAVVAFALFAVASPGRTEQKQPAAAPSANAIKMAREIVELKNSASMVTPMINGVIERVKFMHLQTNPTLRKDLDAVAESLRKQYEPRSAEVMAEIAKFYASAFTEPELKEILTFYRTPTGKKVIVTEPQLFEDAIENLKGWLENLGDEVVVRFRTEMRKRGHDL
jgi:hypothetical protein